MTGAADESATRKNPAARLRRLSFWLLIGVSLALLVVLITGAKVVEIPMLIGFGWARFLRRTIPRISFNPDLAGMTLLCLAGVLLLAHSFLRWLTKAVAAAGARNWAWRWRWTWCGAAAMGAVFLVGMAVGGIAHQVAWMASSPEPWYERKLGGAQLISDLTQLRMGLQTVLDDTKGDLEKARRELKHAESEYLFRYKDEPSLSERYSCLLILEGKGSLLGAILFPRDPSKWNHPRGLLYWFEQQQDFLPMSELPVLLQRHQGHLLAL